MKPVHISARFHSKQPVLVKGPAGNNNYLECGAIKGGACDGDLLWGIRIGEADNQEGCQENGVKANVAIVRNLWIYRKCAILIPLSKNNLHKDLQFNSNLQKLDTKAY